MTIRSAIEPDGTPAARAVVEAEFAAATAAYRDRRASDRLVLKSDP